MTVLAVVQARMSSKRLPGKILMDIAGQPLLSFLLDRLKLSRRIDRIVVATTTKTIDVPVSECAKECGVDIVRGPEEDVLSRYLKVMDKFTSDVVIRVTADNPLTDPAIIDDMIEYMLEGNYDYLYTAEVPVGTAVDLFSAATLKKCSNKSSSNYDREHINAYILNHQDEFKVGTYMPSNEWKRPDISVTVDHEEELKSVRDILARSTKGVSIPIEDIIFISDQKLRAI